MATLYRQIFQAEQIAIVLCEIREQKPTAQTVDTFESSDVFKNYRSTLLRESSMENLEVGTLEA